MGSEEYPVAHAYAVFRNIAKDWDAYLARGERPNPELLRRIFAAVELVLHAYCRPKNFSPDGLPKEHFPVPLANLIANQVGYIRSGYLPSPIKEMVRSGAPGIGPHENRDVCLAVAYRKAAEQGLVNDRHPNKTIAKRYGVEVRSVRRWVRKHPEVDPTDFFHVVERSALAEFLNYATKEAGLRYRQAGRGAAGRTEFPRLGKRLKADQNG